MFSLTQITPTFGDCTAGYRVDLDKEYTVSEFINEVLKKEPNEWGYFKIKKNGMMSEYRYGELLENNFDNEILSAKVSHISASGGWTRMDYYLTIEK
ncbi:hypothetical protein [Phocaeicola plebeius]|uniref:hypothetical protein n=1 Tax=Phocaeicola plebeius TaxID=310297 RepID=UPI003FD80C6E